MSEMQTINEILAEAAPMTLEQIIIQEIDDWKRSPQRKLMVDGEKYYAGDHEILKRKRMTVGEEGRQVEDKHLANHKLVHTFVRKLVDQKVGYLLSKPFSIQTENDAYESALGEVFGKQFLRLMKNLGKDAVNAGKAWLHVYYDADGNFSFKRLPAAEIIPFWKDAEHTQLDALIRFYEVEVYEGRAKRTITKVEYWDSTGVRRYVMDWRTPGRLTPDTDAGEAGSHFAAVTATGEEIPLNWERLPFVCFKYNDEELPLLKIVQSLVDDYDEQTSDNSNTLTELPNAIYVLKNYDGQNLGEFRKNLSMYRAVKVTDDGAAGAGGVDTLSLEMNPEAHKQHIEQLRKDIYEFGRGVDTQSDKFGNSPTGIALRFLYSDLDLDANGIETEFQAALEQLLWFVDQHIFNTTGADYSEVPVDFIFNRDILINETEAITNAKNSVGVISDETIVANHPWTTNTNDELERLEEERQAGLEAAAAYGGLGGDPAAAGSDGGAGSA